MATAVATMSQQHNQHQKALAVKMYLGGATSQDVEKRTGIKASYVRTLAKRISSKSDQCVSQDVSPVSSVLQDETAFQETVVSPVSSVVKQPLNWYGIGFRIICVLIVLFHAVLIAYDTATLWGVPGMIAGCVAFLVVVGTVVVSADKSQTEVSENMVWLVFLVDAAAFFIHYKTFWYANRVKGGLDVTEIETGFFAAFICVFSAAALYFFRASLIKKLEK